MQGETTISAGSRLGDYVVERRLGHGSEGHVFLARDSLLGRQVALKIPASGAAGETRGVEEARLCAKLEHPYVLRAYHSFRHQGMWVIVYEYAATGSLQARIDRDGPYSSTVAIEFASQLASALSYLHDQGFLHRDLKPTNVLLDAQGNVRLADFGLALDLRSPGAPSAKPVGTPLYMAPELWRDEPSSTWSDVYAFGMCLYFVLVGQVAFPYGELEQLRRAHLSVEPRFPPRLPAGLAGLMARMLHKEPARRPSASELVASLGILQGDPHAPPRSKRGRKDERRIAEPFTRESLEIAERTTLERHERAPLSRLCWLLDTDAASIVLSCDHAEEAEQLVRIAMLRGASRYTCIARVRGEECSTALIVVQGRTTDVPSFDSIPALLEHLAKAPPPRADLRPVIELQLPRELDAQRMEELTRLRVVAQARKLGLLGLLAVDPLQGAVPAARALSAELVPMAGSKIEREPFRARLRDWLEEATGGRFVFTSDAVRCARDAHRRGRPWIRIARSSVLIAAACQQQVVASWAVLSALDARSRMQELADVTPELMRRPAAWPTALMAASFASWRAEEEVDAPMVTLPPPLHTAGSMDMDTPRRSLLLRE